MLADDQLLTPSGLDEARLLFGQFLDVVAVLPLVKFATSAMYVGASKIQVLGDCNTRSVTSVSLSRRAATLNSFMGR